MGEPEKLKELEAARRAREEMHTVTESLRALLEDLRDDGDADDPPRVARSRGTAPSQ
jgi:hypothetical protein